jgi:GNAT superfamily N-acetyltransferase
MPHYSLRRATVADADVLVHQRIRMFEDMGVIGSVAVDVDGLRADYRAWLLETMPRGAYVAWVIEAGDAPPGGTIVAGGGATIIPWPPGPRNRGARLAFVYNVYTEPEHRGRGLARRVMDALHGFCRDEGIGALALNASTFGQPLYESLGYQVANSPMMVLSLS